MTANYSGGEVRMTSTESNGKKPWQNYSEQGEPVGYQLIVAKRDDRRFGAVAKCNTMKPLLSIMRQFENLDYEFIRLERIWGG